MQRLRKYSLKSFLAALFVFLGLFVSKYFNNELDKSISGEYAIVFFIIFMASIIFNLIFLSENLEVDFDEDKVIIKQSGNEYIYTCENLIKLVSPTIMKPWWIFESEKTKIKLSVLDFDLIQVRDLYKVLIVFDNKCQK